ncbi:TAT-binding protein-like protein 7, AAA ATPase, partial [Tilletia horrida]
MTTRRAASKHINYNENENYDEEEDAAGSDDFEGEPRATSSGPRSSGRNRRKSQVLREYQGDDDDDEEEELIAPKRTTSASKLKLVLKPKTEVQASTLTRSSARHSTGAGNEDENEDDADGGAAENGDYAPEPVDHDSQDNTRRTRNRAVNYVVDVPSDSDDGVVRPGRGTGKGKAKGPSNSGLDKDGDDDYDDDDNDDDAEYGSRPRRKFKTKTETQNKRFSGMAARSKARRNKDTDDDFVGGSEDSADEEDLNLNDDDSDDIQDIQSSQQGGYGLRQRKKVDYRVPTVDKNGNLIFPKGVDPSTFSSTLFPRPGPTTFVDDTPKKRPPRKNGWNGLPSKMSGKEYEKLFGDGLDSSDDDVPASRRVLGAGLGGGAMLGGLPSSISGLLGGAGGLGAFGGAATAHGAADKDAHLGRIKPGKDGLADVDPFGPNMQVDFSSIGGLDSHVQQLKEMVSLPLLYPEVFQRFKITPPRGVLFHGPPGTGKTLVARALAASCSTEGQQISFFMRKGADCLSKWVGEAERQLRLLFEEAKNSQPSIIFFDEIDGLAPVRSSKQDQIHASIVSTLLALMDGMDGRGQVVVIGATNRPDSVDPALRRPGRFDREFYFPLPDKKARRAILDIHTRGWEPPLPNEFKDRLAEVTKGYGGADMRALCTEAALNAIQRRYPQVYTTNERLLLQPETIRVDAKDFMMSVNKVVPSSKRAGGGSAAALPEHLQPLLEHTVSEASRVLDLMMPPTSKRNALEEAMYEDEAPMASSSGAADARAQDGGFGRELLLQSFEALRVFKPRVLIYGDEGMGQSVVGAAILHHLEGYHVQPLDIATLLGDSTRTPEAAIIQIFQE